MNTHPDWIDAAFRLPRPENLPCEVQLASGAVETRTKLEGSWLKVARWRPLKDSKAPRKPSGKS